MNFILNNIDFEKIKKEVIFEDETFETVKSLIFKGYKNNKVFIYYLIDNVHILKISIELNFQVG